MCENGSSSSVNALICLSIFLEQFNALDTVQFFKLENGRIIQILLYESVDEVIPKPNCLCILWVAAVVHLLNIGPNDC